MNWSEGMFLRPHHFQASDRYWAELAGLHCQFDHPFGYGVSRISVSEQALENGLLQVEGLRARMRDGTIIASASGQVETVDLKTRQSDAAGAQALSVYLAVPTFADGLANVSKAIDARTRYVSVNLEMPDECVGASRQELGLRYVNHRLKLSSEELAGFDLVPLMRLLPSASGTGAYRIDPNYIPPSLSVQAWPELATLLRDIRNFIGSRIKTMSIIIQDQGISLSTQVQGDLEKLWLMQVMNQSYAELSCLAFSSGVHPLVAYTHLCSILGRCSIFGPGAAVDEVPPYDHDDLGRIFRWVCDQIRRLINSVKEDEAVQRYFIGSGPGMHVALEPEWFGPEWEWYFGVCPIGFSVKECFQLFASRKLDVKLGSSDKVEQYMARMQPGLHLKGISQTPRALANRGKWLFFQIGLEGDPWRQVQLSQSLALRINKLQISNLDSLEGNRRLHLSVEGQSYGIEFAVFAVKQRM
ncbi:MAG: type VI secretion system baseplate subunit TssK [Pirellula sp.]